MPDLHHYESAERLNAEEALALVYGELRRLAARKMAGEAAGHTLQPTALVHEAWLRLAGSHLSFANKTHFLAVAGEAMRRVLVDSARKRKAQKRGAGDQTISLEDVDVPARATDETLLAIDDALQKLAAEDPRAAELIKFRFFAGLTNAEAAAALGISERSAKREWTFARAWLARELQAAAT